MLSFLSLPFIHAFIRYRHSRTRRQGTRGKDMQGFASTTLPSCIAAASRDSVTVTLEKPRSKTNETHSFSLNKAFNLPQIYSSRREPCFMFPHRQLAERMLGSTASFPFVRQNKYCGALTSAYFFGKLLVNNRTVFKTPALSDGQFPFHDIH
jgi:hypothetical protein